MLMRANQNERDATKSERFQWNRRAWHNSEMDSCAWGIYCQKPIAKKNKQLCNSIISSYHLQLAANKTHFFV